MRYVLQELMNSDNKKQIENTGFKVSIAFHNKQPMIRVISLQPHKS